MANQFDTFHRRDASEAELREAAGNLGPVAEAPSVWSAIANDASLPEAHRRQALVQLIRRHVARGSTTVGTFAQMLDGARWLSNITCVTALAGKVPVAWSPDDTVVAIALPGGHGAIYLAMAGQFSVAAIEDALAGRSRDTPILATVIRDIGIQEDAGG